MNLILSQIPIYPKMVQLEQRQVKAKLRSQQRSDIAKEADALMPTLPKAKQMAMEQVSEKAASSWLTAIPPARYGFTEVCPNVDVEPQLQPVSGVRFPLQSTNLEDNARLDIRAQNFWDKIKHDHLLWHESLQFT